MKHYLTILLLLVSQSIFGANAKFFNINEIQGSSLRQVTSICKDENGFIWASSKMGIMRVIENGYRIFQIPSKTQDMVYVNLAYDSSMLVAYTNNGQFFQYNQLSDSFKFLFDLREELELETVGIYKVTVTDSHTLLVPSTEGLFLYQEGRLEKLENLSSETIQMFVHYDQNHYLYATPTAIYLLDKDSFQNRKLFSLKQKYDINSIFYDKDFNTLWFGTALNGLYYVEMNTVTYSEQKVEGIPDQLIKAIEDSGRSSLYIGLDGQGVWEVSKAKKIPVNTYKEDIDNPYSLRGNGVYAIYTDKQTDRIWVSTYTGGLSYFVRDSPFITQILHQSQNPNSIGDNDVASILEDRDGDLWFATGNGIYKWSVDEDVWKGYFNKHDGQSNGFISLAEDTDGNIWACGFALGVYCIDRKTGKQTAYYPDTFPGTNSISPYIMCMMNDSSGDVWMGGISSLVCYSGGQFKEYSAPPIHSLEEFRPGLILLGTTEGMYLLEKESGALTKLFSSLTEDIYVEGNIIWAATSGDGLVRYDFEAGTYESHKDGMPSNYVNSIQKINDYLWIGTENGLCRYMPEERIANTYYSYFNPSGLSFNMGAVRLLSSGNVIWGTNNGAVLFNPEVLSSIKLKGKIFFQNISISGRSIREDESLSKGIAVNEQTELSFKYDKNELSLRLFPIGVSVNEVKLDWIMEGLDDKWHTSDNQQIISYVNIPNGNYTLRVRMYDNARSYILDERALNVNVIPLFWQTWEFSLLVLFVLIASVLIIIRTVISRMNHKHAQDKIHFFTNTAHDLRNAISLIVAPVSELKKEEHLSDQGKYYLDLTTQQAAKLNDVATQLLDFQKIDIGKEQLYLKNEDVADIVRSQILLHKASAAKRSVTLLYKTNLQSYICAVDKNKIQKVIENLLSNAIKYSRDGSTVEIELNCSKESWTLSVKDHGYGISAKAQKNLFKEFYRADNSINSHIIGSGIGLILIKQYTQMHGGTVTLDSKEGVGSKFSIIIPYNIVGDEEKSITIEAAETVSAVPATEVEQPKDETGQRKSILLVDDNGDLVYFLKTALERNYHVLTAADGQAAWEIIEKEDLDLVISDVMMPVLDGFELCKRVKSTFETAHIPIILLSALDEKTNKLEGLGLGAEDYITKPFDINILEERIRTIVRNRELIQQRAVKAGQNNAPALKNKLNDAFIRKAAETVRAHISNPDFDKEEFAKEMCVSSSLLYKKIKLLTDLSPIDFIKSIRMNYAMELLETQEYTITEVSEMCGYSSQSYFSTAFKNHFKIKPSEVGR